MITFFTILKPFTDPHIATIQRNAIRSWQQMRPAPEILAFGDKAGVKEACAELGIRHIEGIQCHESGFELVSDAFHKAWGLAAHNLIMYVNADIIFPPFFMDVVAGLDCKDYLMVGQRYNTPITQEINFTPGWWQTIFKIAINSGHMHSASGLDYFLMPVNSFWGLPDLVVGHWYWDNYMVAEALRRNLMVIDATEVVMAVHQQHDYSHVPGGLQGIASGDVSASNRAHLPNGKVGTTLDVTVKLLPD